MIHRIDCPEAKAEGKLLGYPYDTQLVSIDGVACHVWLGDTEPTPKLLEKLEGNARRQRDIVRMTWSDGAPIGFWAHEDIID